MKNSILFIVFLLALGVGFYGFQKQSRGNPPAVTTFEPPPQEYLLFARAIKEGDFIDQGDLKWGAVDAETNPIPETAILFEDQTLADFEGALVVSPASKNDFVTTDLILLPQQNQFLASVLQKGKRAISIEIDAVTGSSGLIQPGNRVDLILFTILGNMQNLRGQADPKSSYMAKTILENVRVIAINRKIARQDQESLEQEYRESDYNLMRQGTATLEVTPKQAEILTVAQRMGTLSLSLRSEFEQSHQETAGHNGGSDSVRSQDVVREFPAVEGNIRALYGTEKQLETTNRIYEGNMQ